MQPHQPQRAGTGLRYSDVRLWSIFELREHGKIIEIVPRSQMLPLLEAKSNQEAEPPLGRALAYALWKHALEPRPEANLQPA